MEVSESDITKKEIQKLSKAYSKAKSRALFFFILYTILFILFNAYDTELDGYSKYSFYTVITLVILNQLKNYIKLLFFDLINKDFEQQKKIIVTLIVLKKEKGHNDSDRLYFKENPYFQSLDVLESSYILTSIGDKIIFELSKYGKWIINVNSNSRIIQYNDYNNFKGE